MNNLKKYVMIMDKIYSKDKLIYACISRLYLDYVNRSKKPNEKLMIVSKEILDDSNDIELDIYNDQIQYLYYNIISYENDLGFNVDNYSSMLYQLIELITPYLYTKEENFSKEYEYLSNIIVKLLDIKGNESIIGVKYIYRLFLNSILKDSEISLNNNINLSMINDIIEMVSIISNESDYIYSIDKFNTKSKFNYSKCFFYSSNNYKIDKKIYDLYVKESNNIVNLKTSAEWLYILKVLNQIDSDFKIVTLVPNNILFRSSDKEVRKYLIENGKIEGVISLFNLSLKEFKSYSLLILSNNNTSINVVDNIIKPVYNGDFNLYINNAYQNYNETVYKKNNFEIKSIDYNLTVESLINDETEYYDHNRVKLTSVASIIKGCNLSLANFKDDLSTNESDYQILSSGEIEEDIINYSELQYINNGSRYEKYIVKSGDVVICSKSTKLKIAYVNTTNDKNIIAIGAITIIRPNNNFIDGAYLFLLLNSNKYRELLNSFLKGTRIKTLSYPELFELTIPPLPSLEEQKKSTLKFVELLESKCELQTELHKIKCKIANYYCENDGKFNG